MKTTIEAYTFQLKENKKEAYLDFSKDPDFFEQITNIESGIIPFIDKDLIKDVPTESRILRVPRSKNPKEVFYGSNKKDRIIFGILETGLYGKRYDVISRESPEKTIYEITKNSAIMKPFFYYIKIPRTGNKGLILLERTDNESIFSLMRGIILSFCQKLFGINKSYLFIKENIVTKEYLNILQDGRFNSVSMTINNPKEDLADRYFGPLSTDEFKIELKLSFKKSIKGKNEKAIKKLIQSSETLFSSKDLIDIFKDAPRKIVSTIGNEKQSKKERTLYVGESQSHLIRPYYELQVKENSDGFSDYKSIQEAVRKFLESNTEFNIFN